MEMKCMPRTLRDVRRGWHQPKVSKHRRRRRRRRRLVVPTISMVPLGISVMDGDPVMGGLWRLGSTDDQDEPDGRPASGSA